MPRTNIPFHLQQHDTTYAARPPDGQLMYRSYDGTLKSYSIHPDLTATHPQIDALNKLGAAFADTKDLYVCAASHMFEFFTGVRANLLDTGDSRVDALASGDQVYKNIVVALGLDLKNHQSLRVLVRSILSSDSYMNVSNRHWQETP